MSEQTYVIVTVEYDIWNTNIDRNETTFTRDYKVETERYMSACNSKYSDARLRRLVPFHIQGRPHVRSYTSDSRIVKVTDEAGNALPLPDLS